MAAPSTLPFTPDEDANRLLASEPLAVKIGMLLDQQVTMEAAFRAPFVLKQRLGGRLDAAAIAAMPADELEAVFRERPALHRFPGSMSKRTHDLCAHLVEHYGDSDVASLIEPKRRNGIIRKAKRLGNWLKALARELEQRAKQEREP